MKKVILNKKQIVIFESYKKTHNLITILNRAEKGFECKDHQEMNKLTLEEIASAWINGYEIEETTEEKLLKKYLDIKEKRNSHVMGLRDEEYYFYDGNINGIELTISVLGLEIKGINI